MTDIQKSAEIIRKTLPGFAPKLALVLGSGLGAVADLLDEKARIPYTDLPGWPRPSVQGHEGLMRLGFVAGVPVIFLKGRVHLYEGAAGFAPLKTMIRTIKALGIEKLFLTNAAGSLNPAYGPGSVVAITDHINFTGMNPLAGPNDDEWGPRFFDMGDAWNRELRTKLLDAAQAAKVDLGTGVYCQFTGPNFETPAEIKMAQAMGAHLVGMSTAVDNIVAHHCGLKCVGVSAVTNLGAGLSDEVLSHDHTMEMARRAQDKMAALVRQFIEMI